MSLADLVANYQPPERAVEVIRHAKITLLVGISGAGKDTIKRALLEDPSFHDIVSHTTRKPRANEGVLEQH